MKITALGYVLGIGNYLAYSNQSNLLGVLYPLKILNHIFTATNPQANDLLGWNIRKGAKRVGRLGRLGLTYIRYHV